MFVPVRSICEMKSFSSDDNLDWKQSSSKEQKTSIKNFNSGRIYNSLRLSTLNQVIPSRAKCFILLISRMMNHILEAAPTAYSLKGEEKSLMGFPKSHRSITAWEANEALSPFLNNTSPFWHYSKCQFWGTSKFPSTSDLWSKLQS